MEPSVIKICIESVLSRRVAGGRARIERSTINGLDKDGQNIVIYQLFVAIVLYIFYSWHVLDTKPEKQFLDTAIEYANNAIEKAVIWCRDWLDPAATRLCSRSLAAWLSILPPRTN